MYGIGEILASQWREAVRVVSEVCGPLEDYAAVGRIKLANGATLD